MAAQTYGQAVIPLVEIQPADRPRIGAKAANLAALLEAGFPVPDGFVICTEAFRSDTTELSSALKTQLEAALAILGDCKVAVRSSAVAEDLPGASFAGQYESVLGVGGLEAVTGAVRRCLESATSPRATAYRAAHRHQAPVAMAVLVQRMVPAEVAGVAFTANPVTGDREETLVNAVRGLGDRLVSGQASPDEWSVRGDKAVCHAAHEDAISAEQAKEVAELARRAEAQFGSPQDVEWALAGGRLYLLQARPITRLAERAVHPVAIEVELPTGYWERDADHWPEPISPSFRFILPLLNRLVRAAMDEAGMLFEELRLQEIGGWTYMRVVPLGGKDRKPPPAWLSRLLMPVMFQVMPKLRKRARSSQRFLASDRCGQYIELWHSEWRADAAARIKEFLAVDLKALDDDDLDGQAAARIDFAEQGWLRHFHLQFPDHLPPAELVFFCQDELGLGEKDALQMLSGLSAKTTEPGHKLAELAALAQRSPNVRRILEEDAKSATGKLHAADSRFAVAFETYQREYGCRSLRVEPAEKTLAECPELLLGLIRDQLARRYDPEAEARLQLDRREAALARARELLVGRAPAVAAHFEHLVERAQRAYPIREDNEFYLVSAPTALYRYVFLEIGRRLLDRGQVSDAEEVFFLEMEEARAALRLGDDQRPLIKRRKGELAWVRPHPGPSSYGQKPGEPPPLDGLPPAARLLTKTLLWMFEGSMAPVESAQRHDPGARYLRGVAGSAGRYRGPVRVILGEAQFGKIRAGDVLVCASTSPVWSVIFPSAGALVTDAGGILAHAALIAREYGVPAVLATGNGTRVLRDGQLVTVDGTAGTVVIEG